MSVADSGKRLLALLEARKVRPSEGPRPGAGSLAAAWDGFKEFAATGVDQDELTPDPQNDGLLYEYGVFDWGEPWGSTFELSLVRQYSTVDGDLQQVHLVAHYPASVLNDLRAALTDSTWSWDTGGSTREDQTQSWIDVVESSPVFLRLKGIKPLGYEIWQESAE